MISSRSSSVPLCIDLDGTLIKTDLLYESLARLLKQKPWLLLMVPFWCLRGRAVLKRRIAQHVSVNVASLPYNLPLLEWLRHQKAANRRLVLATAAEESLARQVADYIGLFDGVLASDGLTNLKGKQKLRALREEAGVAFDYVGNSRADLEIWQHCKSAITVGVSSSLLKRVRESVRNVAIFDVRLRDPRSYAAALRLHQWAKNVLIYIPLITAHQIFDPVMLVKSSLSVLLFSLCTSAQYVLNDLIDLEADRQHPKKQSRPFASGSIPLQTGFIMAPVLLVVSIIGALLLSKWFALLLISYFALSFFYSLHLKKIVLLDAFILSGLYMTRIIAGHLVTGVPFSIWLLSFAFFVFLSLAFDKRWLELDNTRRTDRVVLGRGYEVGDIAQVNLFGVCSAFLSVVIFILYLQSDKVKEMYKQPELLWVLSPLFLYWISRIWILSSRGKINEDPVIFVLKDPVTYVVGIVSGLIMFAATADWTGMLLPH
jgi:4-hydroxybenzoate polyprenyltransferase/phosphoglycolate phosphatase-like HAD superfamily hydrolase